MSFLPLTTASHYVEYLQLSRSIYSFFLIAFVTIGNYNFIHACLPNLNMSFTTSEIMTHFFTTMFLMLKQHVNE